MDHSVKLPRLPSDLAFPERLQDRIRYDAQRGELIYRGFMTKCTYDQLSSISDDADYHRALERLFVLTSAEVAPTSKMRLPAVAIAAAIGAVAIGASVVWFRTRHDSAADTAPQQDKVTVATVAP